MSSNTHKKIIFSLGKPFFLYIENFMYFKSSIKIVYLSYVKKNLNEYLTEK